MTSKLLNMTQWTLLPYGWAAKTQLSAPNTVGGSPKDPPTILFPHVVLAFDHDVAS